MSPQLHVKSHNAPFSPPLTPPLKDVHCTTDINAHFSKIDLPSKSTTTHQRMMGGSELSYYLPSRADGVNDMYLHIGFRAPGWILEPARVRAVWAILRLRHPLLAARVCMHDYDDVRFVYDAPQTPQSVLEDAERHLEFRHQSKHDLIHSYLNGDRTLSNERLSYLVISAASSSGLETPLQTPDVNRTLEQGFELAPDLHEYDLLICAAHFIGDGMALHNFANDFFGILGSEQTAQELEDILSLEFESWKNRDAQDILPEVLESRLPRMGGTFKQTAAKIDFSKDQAKLIGGHALPRRKSGPRNTVVPTVPLDTKRTKQVLQKCKANGVSVANALFAVCNIAWIRMSSSNPRLPILMYSALNLRPYLNPTSNASYWYLAVGYFNVILPNFLPRTVEVSKMFWHRAREAKLQSTRTAKHPLLVSRAYQMALERGSRARDWAKEDDVRERGVWVAPPPSPKTSVVKAPAPPKPPSTALVGLSLLGNLDGMYKHGSFPTVQLHTLTTGSRQRSGASLLFGYTFASKLWLSFGYDENGLDRDVVERFWSEVLNGVDEFLVA